MSKENGLPKGWAKSSLNAVGSLYCGQSPSVSQVNRNGEGTPYVTGPEQWDGSTLTVDKWTTHPRRLVPNGCIFITVKGAGVGTLFSGVACAIGRDVYAFYPRPELSKKFIEYSLRFNISEILRHAKGDIPGLSKSHILDHVAAFPPLNEQRRIVARIEELFSNLDAGVAALERAKANLKRYRASVLKAAVEGRLTADWRAAHPDVEPADKLLERILVERREKWEADQLAKFQKAGKNPPKGWREKYKEPKPPETSGLPKLPEGWCWASVEQVAREGRFNLAIGPFGSNLKVSDYQASGVPLVFVRNIRSAKFDGDGTKYVTTEKALELAAHSVEAGDVLVTKMGDPPGDVCLYPPGGPKAIITADCIKVRVNTSLMDAKLFVHAVGSQTVRQQIVGITKGVAQQKVSLSRFIGIAVPLSPLKEQYVIVEDVAERLSQIEAAEATIEQGLKRAARLRQSILKRAFEGKLVPHDPTDEPADVLLERIRAERDAYSSEEPKARGKKKSRKKAGGVR